jgi:hypothetical protein
MHVNSFHLISLTFLFRSASSHQHIGAFTFLLSFVGSRAAFSRLFFWQKTHEKEAKKFRGRKTFFSSALFLVSFIFT